MSQSDDPRNWIKEMEMLVNTGRRSLLPEYVIHGNRDEASRRYNVCVFLNYTVEVVGMEAIRHILFEDEALDDELLEEVRVAVHLEEAFFGAFQLSLGNEWGKKIISSALGELDGMEMTSSALILATALTNMVKGTCPKEELAEESSP